MRVSRSVSNAERSTLRGYCELWLGALPLELPHVEDPTRGHGQHAKHPGPVIARATAATRTKAPCHPGGHAPIEAGARFASSRHAYLCCRVSQTTAIEHPGNGGQVDFLDGWGAECVARSGTARCKKHQTAPHHNHRVHRLPWLPTFYSSPTQPLARSRAPSCARRPPCQTRPGPRRTSLAATCCR